MRRRSYPFSAVAGQTPMKRALLACGVDPSIGGVLLRGEKGTAKSTAARGLASLLTAASGDEVPFVDLPVNVTEDRLAGAIDLESAVREGRRVSQPGLLARAHGGVLYVDEVNLLPDHAADMLLDAAASGVCAVEREGVSATYESRFALVASMNPEEGELRPQLTDRFGLCVDVAAERDPDTRVEVMRRLEAFEADPASFARRYAPSETALASLLVSARARLPGVAIDDALRTRCAQLAAESFAAGNRAETVILKTARALAALAGRSAVCETDVTEAAALALAHRRRMAPPPPPRQEPQQEHPHDKDEPENRQDTPPESQPRQEAAQGEEAQGEGTDGGDGLKPGTPDQPDTRPPPAGNREQLFEVGQPFRVKPIQFRPDRLGLSDRRGGSGRRTRTRTVQSSGRHVRDRHAGDRMNDAPRDLALAATLRAAAPCQMSRRLAAPDSPNRLILKPCDLRSKVREKRVGALLVLAVDASGSMGAARRMVEAKGAVLSLLLDAYQKRDKVALVAFKGETAEVLLEPTSSVERALVRLEELPTGGRTPLAAGLVEAWKVVDRELRRNPFTLPIVAVISDGKANAPLTPGERPLREAMAVAKAMGEEAKARFVVIDVERPGPLAFGLAGTLAEYLNARHFKLEELRARDVADILRGEADAMRADMRNAGPLARAG